MIIKLSLLLVSLMLLPSCGDNWDKESDENINHPAPIPIPVSTSAPTPTIYYEQIIESEDVLTDTFVTDVKADDTLIFTFSGKSIIPQFGPVYERTFTSNWKVKLCRIIKPRCPSCNFLNKKFCWETPRQGECNLKYRDSNEDKEHDIVFTNNINDTKLRLKIGDNVFPIGKVINYSGLSLTTEFKITEAMLQKSNEVYLIILPDIKGSNVKIGYLGVGSCQGYGERYFSHNGPTVSSNRLNQVKRKFRVSVSFKKISEEI